jgi:hypothetical protein
MPSLSFTLFRRVAWPALLLLSLLGAGCTTEPAEPERRPENAVVLPVFTLHKELRGDVAIVQNQLVRALKDAGYKCVELSADEFEKIQRVAFEESGSIYNPTVGEYVPLEPGRYRVSLLQQLRGRKFDVVILPELQLRAAQVQANNILWDGVTRNIEVRGNSQYLAPRQARGLSLLVAAYGNTGALVGRGIGGITVPFYLDATTADVQFRLRDAFYDVDEVSEGVAIAVKGLRHR